MSESKRAFFRSSERTTERFSEDEIANLSEVDTCNIRDYMAKGLLPSLSVGASGEHYTRLHLERLLWIRRCRDEGMSIKQIIDIIQGVSSVLSERSSRTFAERSRAQEMDVEREVPVVDLDQEELDQDILRLLSRDVAIRHQVVPLSLENDTLRIAMVDPSCIYAIDDVRFITGYRVEVFIASEDSIAAVLEQYPENLPSHNEAYDYGILEEDLGYDVFLDEVFSDEEDEDTESTLEGEGEDVSVRLINLILAYAVRRCASAILIEPDEASLCVRFRIDGVLEEVMLPPKSLQDMITTRIKVISQMDLAERRLPQDGRIEFQDDDGWDHSISVSLVPTTWGEKITLKIFESAPK